MYTLTFTRTHTVTKTGVPSRAFCLHFLRACSRTFSVGCLLRSLVLLPSFLVDSRMYSFLLFAIRFYVHSPVLCRVSSSTFPHSFLRLATTTMPVDSPHAFWLRRVLALRSLCLPSCFLTHPSIRHPP